MNIDQVLFVLLFYFLGGIPSALLVAHFLDLLDPREHGSGNLGATNMYRVSGKKAGLVTLIMDMLKFVIPAFYVVELTDTTFSDLCWLGVAAVFGHCYSPYLKFKGGKGVSVSLMVVAFCSPVIATIDIVAWILLIILTRYVAVASISVALLTAVLAIGSFSQLVYIDEISNSQNISMLLIAVLVIYRHKDNIRRLIESEEPKAY